MADPGGRVTDPLAVYGALLPKAKVATVPHAAVRLVDTVLCAGGRVWKWLYTAPSGEVAERVHADVESIHAAFLQSGGHPARAAVGQRAARRPRRSE
jgi:hypothetical protein